MIHVFVRGTVLDENEQHHLRVRRAAEGELVELRDGKGMVGRGRLTRSGKVWSVDIETATTLPPPPPLVIAAGAGDRERFGWLVEKATELGVTTIVPLETARTPGVASKLRQEQIERFQRRAFEAIKQSGAAWAPVVETPCSLNEFAARSRAGQSSGHRWLADPAGDPPSGSLDAAPVVVAVGPEGGFTGAEREHLIAQGFAPTMFGPHVLRFETAAVAAAVAVSMARRRGQHG